MATLRRPDVDLYYELDGAGPALLLIPGLASDSGSWAPVRARLSAHFRLVLMDIRGAGRTVPHEAPLSVALIAADALALLDHLQIGRAHILGHSLGGLIAHHMAVRWPGRVSRLVVAASGAIEPRTAGLLEDLGAARAAGLAPELWFRLLFQWLFRPAFLADARRVADAARLAAAYPYLQSAAAYAAQLAAAIAAAPRDGQLIEAPTLVICGVEDVLTASSVSRSSFDDIAQVSWASLADAAHSMHWDQPERFASLVQEFLTVDTAPSHR